MCVFDAVERAPSEVVAFDHQPRYTHGITICHFAQTMSEYLRFHFDRLNNNNNTVLRERKPPPRQKSQPKVIRDSNPDFRINLASELVVYRLAPKMLQIHCLVGISRIGECRENRSVTV